MDLSIFAFGQKADKERLKKLADQILAKLIYRKDDELVKLSYLPKEQFREFIRNAQTQIDYSEVVKNWDNKPIRVKQFKKELRNF
ncbi:MAG: hypothetical protein U5K72_16030 [Balneolaceae bacterium]|nr:hypothetical protein [Balneolaceae bacterium]